MDHESATARWHLGEKLMEMRHPWQSGPTELLLHAIDHLHQPSEFDQRIAFLLLDVGVETIFKTFLQLPESVTGTEMGYEKRISHSRGNFHQLTEGIEAAAKTRLKGIDLRHVEFYHSVRNRLYHEGNGITVPTKYSKEYASLAVQILDRLLGVDLQEELARPERELKRREDEKAIVEQFRQRQVVLRRRLSTLERGVRLALERVDPALVLPSFERTLEEWSFDEDILWSWESWLHGLDAVDDHWRQCPDELRQSLPKSLQRFAENYEIKPSTLFHLCKSNAGLLAYAEIALGLPGGLRIGSTYRKAKMYTDSAMVQQRLPLFPDDQENPLERALGDIEDLIVEVDEIRDALSVQLGGNRA